MSDAELIDTLRDMYESARPHREQMTALILFGILYADEIEDMTLTRRELYRAAGVGVRNVEVGYGINLSKYVELDRKPIWL